MDEIPELSKLKVNTGVVVSVSGRFPHSTKPVSSSVHVIYTLCQVYARLFNV